MLKVVIHCVWSADDPIAVAILDGKTISIYLEDEDDFAMIAENLFTELDAEDKGKIKKSEIRNALVRMGVEMGVPPISGLLLIRFLAFSIAELLQICTCRLVINEMWGGMDSENQ